MESNLSKYTNDLQRLIDKGHALFCAIVRDLDIGDPEAKKKLKEVITHAYEGRTRTFGNGRLVRNLFEKIVERQANRIAAITPLTEEVLCTITADDVPEDIGNLTYGLHK